MAFGELELKRIEHTVGRLCRRRSPAHLTQQLRLEYRVNGHEVIIVERRPRWDNPAEWGEAPIAKLKFVRTVKQWQLYWQRANLKWYGYEPFFSSSDVGDLVREIDADPHGCFFG
ncbi:MAG: DUF3024 domain-containing protein [Nitrospira sp.]|nr:DUF3024 domain-containing protein [Nitrospira sp.]